MYSPCQSLTLGNSVIFGTSIISLSGVGLARPQAEGTQRNPHPWGPRSPWESFWALQQRQAHCCVMPLPFLLAVLGQKMQLHGFIFQWDTSKRDPLLIIKWIFLSYRSPKTIFTAAQIIIRARVRLLTIAGKDIVFHKWVRTVCRK